MNVYFIAGIAADYRVFHLIELPEGFQMKFIQWIDPLDQETLSGYAARLCTQVEDKNKCILVGMSLGGIVAAEMAKIISPVCTILISSVPVHTQLPPYFRLFRIMRLHRLVPGEVIKWSAMLKHTLLNKKKFNRKLMKAVIQDSDPRFIRWAMKAVLDWHNEVLPIPFYHIHGTWDKVFPLKYTQANFQIKGGHMLVLDHAEEINFQLARVLEKFK